MPETLQYFLMTWTQPQLLFLTAIGTFAGIYIGAIPGAISDDGRVDFDFLHL